MKRVTNTIEILGTAETEDGCREVCATAEATYDESAHVLTVKLDSFLRSTGLRTRERIFSADWLPKAETVRETVGSDETSEIAREIFHRWAQKVRQAASSLQNLTFNP